MTIEPPDDAIALDAMDATAASALPRQRAITAAAASGPRTPCAPRPGASPRPVVQPKVNTARWLAAPGMQCVSHAAFGLCERFSVAPLLAGGSAIAQESEGGMQCGIWRRKLRFPVLISLTGFGIGGWYGSAIGIAAFGTAISGWLPIGVLRIVSI